MTEGKEGQLMQVMTEEKEGQLMQVVTGERGHAYETVKDVSPA
jgi:hypothetical protein